jgi:tripartite ATP-independent transporter DctM subunit
MIVDSGWVLFTMASIFLVFGYIGVPVPFALMAGVFAATMLTPISMPSMVGQLFNGLDAEALLAVPFFLLVGELMTSAEVTRRMIRLAQTLIGHLRGGLAQVVTLFSMFFAGISGSSTADVAVLSRTIAPEMKREGYSPGFIAALIASASTIANLIPPSIMAVVYGATGNVSIAGLFLGGVVPGVLIGLGLMVYIVWTRGEMSCKGALMWFQDDDRRGDDEGIEDGDGRMGRPFRQFGTGSRFAFAGPWITRP